MPIPDAARRAEIDGKPFPAPITVSPLVAGGALRVRLVPDRTTSSAASCPTPTAALGDRERGAALRRARRHGPRLERAAADPRLERLARVEGRHRERPLAAAVPLDRGRRASRSPSGGRAARRRARPRWASPRSSSSSTRSRRRRRASSSCRSCPSGSSPRSWACSRRATAPGADPCTRGTRCAAAEARAVPTITAVPRLELIPPGEFARVAGADARPRRAARAPRRHVPLQRAHGGQARGLGAPRLDVQLARPRRAPALGGAERRRARLRLARPRRLLLVEGPRRPRASTRRSTRSA